MVDADDPRRAPPQQLLPRGFFESLPPGTSLFVNASVGHVTGEMADAMRDVAEITHVKPKQTILRYTLGGTAMVAALVAGLLVLAKHLGMGSEALAVMAVLVVGAPFGFVAAKVLPKMLMPKPE